MRDLSMVNVVVDKNKYRRLLKEKNLHQYDISRIAGIPDVSLSTLINAKTSNLNGLYLYRIAKILDCTIEDLLKEI